MLPARNGSHSLVTQLIDQAGRVVLNSGYWPNSLPNIVDTSSTDVLRSGVDLWSQSDRMFGYVSVIAACK